MGDIEFNIYLKITIFLSMLFFILGYLFQNLIFPINGLFILLFLIYTNVSFKQKLGKISIKRTILEKQIFVNHPVNVKTYVKNHGGQININFYDKSPDNSTIIRGKNRFNGKLKSNEEIILEYQIKLSSRGKNEFPPSGIEISDKWNLYCVKIEKKFKTIIWAHSDPKEIQKAKRVSQREHIEIDAPSITGLETMDEMEGIRDFQPGDKLKDIDWKATSRLQKIMTKLFEKKEVLDTIVLLDCSYSMRRSTGKKSKIDHATNIAVHLTKILQSIRHPIGLIAYDEYKIIKNIQPTDNYNNIFENLTDLPGIITTQGYKTKKTIESSQSKTETSVKEQRFISTVFPFLAKGKRNVKNPLQASGIYESVRILMMDNQTKHIIIITDMETNIQSLYRAITLAHDKRYIVWLLTSFSPYFNIDKKDLTAEKLEDLYSFYTNRENILNKLRKKNIEIVELTPSMEGVKVIEQIRGKRK